MDQDKRIGFIIDNIYRPWDNSIWPSFVKSAINENLNFYIFPGGVLDRNTHSDHLRNSIYSLINKENLDGLICYTISLLNKGTNKDKFNEFHDNFESIPYITLASKIPGHTNLDFDGYAGMKQLITHCIEAHGAKKIAFLRGPASHVHTLERLRAYKDALLEAKLPYNPDSPLITDPFSYDEGDVAAAQLYEERKLKPGLDFDTLVGASDELAIKAINYFSNYGYRVPQDYHVIGFDNTIESMLNVTPISTVAVPYTKIGKESFRILEKYMDGKNSGNNVTIDDVIFTTKLVIRESCGCRRYYFHKPKTEISAAEPDIKTLTAKIVSILKVSENDLYSYVKPLIKAWQKIQLENPENPDFSLEDDFFNLFEESVTRLINTEGDPNQLFVLFNEIVESGLISVSQFKMYEPALYTIIFRIQERVAAEKQFKRENLNAVMNSLKVELIRTRDRISLIKCIAKHLPEIGIATAGLALYNDDNTSLWVGSYSPEGISPIEEQLFPAGNLVPLPLKQLFSRGIFLVQPLFVETRALGYLVHTVSSFDGTVYEDIRATISYALNDIFLYEEMVKSQQKALESMEQSRILALQKEAIQAASDAKSQFLANVSHEIRTPMNAILGMSDLMLSEKLNLRHKQYIEDIKTSAMALLEIINQILDMSKIQAGKINLIPIHYDFKALVDNISSMARFLIKNENVVFDMNIDGEMPKYLYGDNVRLRQILLNLLSNAIKFTKSGYIQLALIITDTEIKFIIKDSGIGIPKEEMPFLFDEFRQLDEKKNRDTKGTGLGLTITKALVEMMNGKIEVESIYGRGATFSVTIPKIIGDEKKISHSTEGERVICSPDTKILVIDDNAINLNVISGLLLLSGVVAFTAKSGRDAIEMLHQNSYDLIFMDHMMPEMDGIEALEKIREMNITTPVIALTANAVTSAKEMLLTAGMNDFLSKPIVKEELNNILLKWIPGSKLINAEIINNTDESGESGINIAFWENFCADNNISLHIGLERVSGQIDVYENLLKTLISEISKCTANLRKFISANDMAGFAIESHSMKSSLANIGAIELSSKAYELETASLQKNTAFCISNIAPFEDKLHDLQKKLEEAFLTQNQNKGSNIASPALLQILKRLRKSIKQTNYEKINAELKNLEDLRLDGMLKDEVEEIKNTIIVMDYDNALEKIQKLL